MLKNTYGSARKQFNKAVANFQVNAHALGIIQAELLEAKTFAYSAAALATKNKDYLTNAVASAVYYQSSTKVVQSTLKCLQLHGGNGYTTEYGMGQGHNDSILYIIGAGASQIQMENICRELLPDYTNITKFEQQAHKTLGTATPKQLEYAGQLLKEGKLNAPAP